MSKDQRDARLARVIEAKRARDEDNTGFNARRTDHDRIVAEVPCFLNRLAGAIGELNDQLSEAGLILALNRQLDRNAAEAGVRIDIEDGASDRTYLAVTVDGRGGVHAAIFDDGRPRPVGEMDLFATTRDDLLNWLITLLEVRYLDDAPQER